MAVMPPPADSIDHSLASHLGSSWLAKGTLEHAGWPLAYTTCCLACPSSSRRIPTLFHIIFHYFLLQYKLWNICCWREYNTQHVMVLPFNNPHFQSVGHCLRTLSWPKKRTYSINTNNCHPYLCGLLSYVYVFLSEMLPLLLSNSRVERLTDS